MCHAASDVFRRGEAAAIIMNVIRSMVAAASPLHRGHHGSPWITMEPSWTPWDTMDHRGTIVDTMDHHGTIVDTMEPSWIPWNIMDHHGTSWITVELSWIIVKPSWNHR
jgi:hypothetical protein